MLIQFVDAPGRILQARGENLFRDLLFIEDHDLLDAALKTVVVVVDTSGSIGHKTLQAWGAEVNAVLEEAKPERVILIDADARVAQVREYTSDDLPLTFDEGFRGRGGTDFRPAFKWIDENDVQPDAVLYLTDLYGTFPEQEPEYPVLWGACNTGKAPWGETIHVEVT